MGIVTGVGTSWNLPNYSSELFTASPANTPLFSLIGGMTGGVMTSNCEFATNQLFTYPDAEQPAISETASVTAPTPRSISRTQEKNVCQIHQLSLSLTYHKLANSGRMSGINTAGQMASPDDELAWQITHSLLIPAARDIEYSFIQGKYNLATNSNEANKTRGMLELCNSANGTEIDALANPLSFELLQALYKEMADAGARFENMIMFVPAGLKQQITEIYGEKNGFNLPQTRNEGGINITSINTDFSIINVIWNRFMPNDTILLCDINYMQPVFLEVPGKGVMFVEEIANTGASKNRQLYGEVGLDHGPAFLHGSIINIK